MKMYEAAPGHWLPEGVSMQEHKEAMAGNYEPDSWEEEPSYVEQLIAKNDGNQVWITRNDERILYENLSDEHIVNIVKMLQKNGRGDLFPNLWIEYSKRFPI